MGHKEHGGTWHMEAAQLDTQRKKGEAILKTSSTVHSTNRSSSSTRPAKLQLDRAGSQSVDVIKRMLSGKPWNWFCFTKAMICGLISKSFLGGRGGRIGFRSIKKASDESKSPIVWCLGCCAFGTLLGGA
ncbi:unnamed protein product [Microthlaspi erraticum]|uniref:Uncharacterized protein n=1 Tax=Microthlaspi erraticum TaxID=1685480 RepID=A0A6D2HKP8_9BRAS|nr:unnamed protein product [Microthlaspi erraticum]